MATNRHQVWRRPSPPTALAGSLLTFGRRARSDAAASAASARYASQLFRRVHAGRSRIVGRSALRALRRVGVHRPIRRRPDRCARRHEPVEYACLAGCAGHEVESGLGVLARTGVHQDDVAVGQSRLCGGCHGGSASRVRRRGSRAHRWRTGSPRTGSRVCSLRSPCGGVVAVAAAALDGGGCHHAAVAGSASS